MKFIKFIIHLIKSIITSSILILVIAMLLLYFEDYITDSDIKSLIEIISIALFGLYFIHEAYKDITRHLYITHKYIILTNIVILLAFAFTCYLEYKHYDNIESLIIKESRIRWAFLTITITNLVKEYLKSDKFLNNVV